MSDSESSAKSSRSRSASRAKSERSASESAGEPAKRSKSRSRSRKRRSRSRSHDKSSRSRSRSYRRRHSRSRSSSYDRKRSSKYRDSGSRRGYHRDRSRSPFSSRRRHQGDRENPRQSRCLGVFGLSLYTQERDLREVFEHYGPIDDLQIVYDHQTGRSRGFAFIYMRNYEDAVEAKEMAPGTEIDGRKIRVDFSITQRAHTPTPGVYLGRPSESLRRGRKGSPVSGGRRRSRSYSRSYSRSPRRY